MPIMTAIDFEKAFDSVNWKLLGSFGFGESFRAWIKTFYNNISSSVTMVFQPLLLTSKEVSAKAIHFRHLFLS